MIVEQYLRKSFPVEGVRVTIENLEEVAKWCDGAVRDDSTRDNPTDHPRYIKVRVHNPLTERQTKAFVGDWVLFAGKGYKVYTDAAFRKSFDVKDAQVVPVNVFETGESTNISSASSSTTTLNPGGTTSV